MRVRDLGDPGPREHCDNLNASCVENAECDFHDPAVDPIVEDLRHATAQMLFQSGANWYLCTGGLIESGDGTSGHFLTANHCISTEAEAASRETYFHFTTECPPGGEESGAAGAAGPTRRRRARGRSARRWGSRTPCRRPRCSRPP